MIFSKQHLSTTDKNVTQCITFDEPIFSLIFDGLEVFCTVLKVKPGDDLNYKY